MLEGKRNPGQPTDISPTSGATGSGSSTNSSSGNGFGNSGTFVEGPPDMWWSDWLNIPSGSEIEAHVTFGDGEQVT